MNKLLVVDDEPEYGDLLAERLSLQGYEVRTAAGAREAIALGTYYRPNVLIADWMLQESIHGLRLSDALRIVDPQLRTILITGFASPDLRSESGARNVFAFLEKPFDLTRLTGLVQQAIAAPPPARRNLPVGVVEVSRTGTISYTNPDAREMFSEAIGSGSPGRLGDVIGAGGSCMLDVYEAAARWVKVRPARGPEEPWYIRSRKLAQGSWLVALLRAERVQELAAHPAVNALLDVRQSARERWPFMGRALVAASESSERRVMVKEFEEGGVVCHTAENRERALAFVKRDPGIDFIVVSRDVAGESRSDFVSEIEAVCPEATIVGTGEESEEQGFSAAGIRRFIRKGWKLADLVRLLRK